MANQKSLKIGVYSPYLSASMGGGEKHVLTCAALWSQEHTVEVILPDEAAAQSLRERAPEFERLFHLDLSSVQWVSRPAFSSHGSAWQRFRTSAQYDAFLFVTDGSMFACGAKCSILHIQVPYTNAIKGLINRLKLATWRVKNANSIFTQQVVERSWKTTVPFVHYPYVDTASIPFPPPHEKTNSILAVGRFYDYKHTDLHAKRQDALVDAFIAGCKEHSWKKRGVTLRLVGSVEPGEVHERFVNDLKQRSQGLPIEFHHNVSHQQLAKWYDESLLFWHAAGLDADEELHPEQTEHFGMSIVEAMAHGALPIVVWKGGVRETVEPGKNGYMFSSIDELVEQTEKLLSTDRTELIPLQQAARAKAESFSLERFNKTLNDMLHYTL